MRVAVFQTADHEYRMIWSFHHILLDGWCLSLLYSDLLKIYDGLRQGLRPELAPVRPYADYFRWLSRQDRGAAEAFWRDYVAGDQRCASLPPFTPAPESGSRVASHRFAFAPELAAALKDVAATNGVTLNTVIQGIWAILLVRLNNSADVTFGVTVGGRPAELPGIEKTIGLFINTLPKRISLGGDPSFAELLQSIQRDSVACAKHDFYPLADIQGISARKQRLFDHLLVYENFPEEALERTAAAGALQISYTQLYQELTYPLSVLIDPAHAIDFQFLYDTAIHAPLQIEQIQAFLTTIASGVATDVHRRVSDIGLWRDASPDRRLERGALESRLVDNELRRAFVDRMADLAPDAERTITIENRDGHPSPDGVTGTVFVDGESTGFFGRWRFDGTLRDRRRAGRCNRGRRRVDAHRRARIADS